MIAEATTDLKDASSNGRPSVRVADGISRPQPPAIEA